MNYVIDLTRISLTDYMKMLKNQTLLPSRRILAENIDVYFESLQNSNIDNVFSLKKALSSPAKISLMAIKLCIPENYLIILKREIGSLDQKPVHLSEFPGIDQILLNELKNEGINTSKEYYEIYARKQKEPHFLYELFCLSDLVRINGVGALAAKTFYAAGYVSVSDVANASADRMLDDVSKVNEEKKYYNAKLGVKDMQFCIDFAKILHRF